MFRKLSFSLFAALVLSAAAGVARAAPTQAERAEEGNPDSVSYADRMAGAVPPTNDEINAAERAAPDSVENKDRSTMSGGDWRAEWQALESEDPDFGG
jgi:hypothetical protein